MRIGEVVLSERVVAYEPAALVRNAQGQSVVQPRPEIDRAPHGILQDVNFYRADAKRLREAFEKAGGAIPKAPAGKEDEYRDHVASAVAVHLGTIASGEKLLRDPTKLREVREGMHGKTEVGEMEAAGLVEACRRTCVPWLVVRGISDFGDELKDDQFHGFAARAAATALVDFIQWGLDLGPGPAVESLGDDAKALLRPTAAPPVIGSAVTNAVRDPFIPATPDQVFGRTEAMRELKRRLGVAGAAGAPALQAQVLTAVRGMAGVGKTTLAAHLAADAEVMSLFQGGVLWAALGETPQVDAELARWGAVLGDARLWGEPVSNQLAARIAMLLAGRRCLLIVDDVWKSEHVAPFQRALVPGSVLLVTTRQRDVAAVVARTPDAQFDLPELRPEDALAMLAYLAPQVMAADPAGREAMLGRLGHLPIAVNVAARHLRAEIALGVPVDEAIQSLSADGTILDAPAPPDAVCLDHMTTPNVAALLRRSINRLGAEDRARFAMLGSLPPKPASVHTDDLALLWQTPNPLPTLRALVERGVVDPVGKGRFQLHALMTALARSLQR